MLNRLIILTVLAAVHFAQAQKDDAVDLARLVRTAEASKGQCEDPAAFLNNSVNRVLATNSGIRHWRPQSEEQLEKLFVALEKYQSIGAESAAALSLAAHGHFANLNPLQPPLHHLSQCHFQEVTRAIGQMISYFHEAKVSKSKRRNFSEVILTFLKNNCRGPSFIADCSILTAPVRGRLEASVYRGSRSRFRCWRIASCCQGGPLIP